MSSLLAGTIGGGGIQVGRATGIEWKIWPPRVVDGDPRKVRSRGHAMSSTATNQQFSATLVALAVALWPGIVPASDEGASTSALIKKAAIAQGAR